VLCATPDLESLILQQIALVSLIAQSPEFSGCVSTIPKELSKIVNVAEELVTGGWERGVVISMEEDDRDVPMRSSI
jgi:hypothetical protein